MVCSPRRKATALPLGLALVVAGALSLGGCAKPTTTVADPMTTGSVGSTAGDRIAGAVDQLGKSYAASPTDRKVAVAYAQALRLNGQTQQAVAVLQQAILQDPKDIAVASAYGKALASNGDFNEALKVIRGANPPTQPDWRLLSAEAAVLDQMGQQGEARQIYGEALKIAPGEPSVLNNLGLSYLLSNDLTKAEATLTQAAASPRADSRVRQNLALALGLQGKFDAAEKVARNELSPDQAEANMAYLHSMLSQENSWKQIKQSDKSKPKV